MLDQELFRDVMAKFASGVVIVTTNDTRGYHGVTVSSFCSVSLEPPLVLVCIDRNIQSHDLITAAPVYAINILSRSQSFLAEQFSGRTPLADPAFSRVDHKLAESGVPLLTGSVGWIECSAWRSYDGGDHTIFVGRVEQVALGDEDDPLVYFDRGFTDLAWG